MFKIEFLSVLFHEYFIISAVFVNTKELLNYWNKVIKVCQLEKKVPLQLKWHAIF